jgi:CRP-like cAMP-binding protein
MSTRTRSLIELPALAQRALELLLSPHLPLPFGEADARALLPYLRLIDAPPNALLIAQGDRDNTRHLLMLLEGEVSVDQLNDEGQPVQLAVLGAGQMLGEMSFVDGQPRSMSCTALSEVRAAALPHAALQRLLDEQPAVAARFLGLLAHRISERLRGLGDQLALYAKLLEQQQGELQRLSGR